MTRGVALQNDRSQIIIHCLKVSRLKKKSPMAHGTLDFEKGFLPDTQLLEDIGEEAVQFLHLSISSKVRIALTVLAQTTAERHQDKDEAILKSAAKKCVRFTSFFSFFGFDPFKC